MQDFVVRYMRSEFWRDPTIEERNGVTVRAFTPWGAGIRSPFSGLKNFEVVSIDGTVYRPFYPASPTLLSLLDAPTRALFILRQIFNA